MSCALLIIILIVEKVEKGNIRRAGLTDSSCRRLHCKEREKSEQTFTARQVWLLGSDTNTPDCHSFSISSISMSATLRWTD